MACYLRLPLAAIAVYLLCATAPVRGDSELDSLIDEAMAHSPKVLAARQVVAQALASHRELLQFFDPSLYVASGKAKRELGVPDSTGFTSVTNNAEEVNGGVQVPIEPGAYLSLGGAERLLRNPVGYTRLYQTLLGVQVRIPLVRDRGFYQWDMQRAQTLAAFNGAVDQLLTVMQDLRHSVELAYINCYETLSAYQVAKEATSRFQGLLDEARELVKLKVVPAYQVYPAQMEVEERHADELQALEAHEQSLVQLSGLLGTQRKVTLKSGPAILVKTAHEAKLPPDIPIADAVSRSGAYLALKSQIEGVRAQLRGSQDDLRPDVSLDIGVTWLGENPGDPVPGVNLTTDKPLGGAVTLVWTRPLEFRGAHSQIARFRAQISELKDRLADVEIGIETDLKVAVLAYHRAQQRLGHLDQAAEAAQKTVEAEQERFRLGEGRSQNVLDAQKDLTDILQLQTQTAAELLQARSNAMFAVGYRMSP